MAKEFLSGFVPVCFVDFWFADQLNSLALVFLDIEFFFCFYIKQGINDVQGVENVTTTITNTTSHENDTQMHNTTIATTTTATTTAGIITQMHNATTTNEPIAEDRFQCGTYDYGIRYFFAVLPAYFRLAQCFRRAKDSQIEANKHPYFSRDYKKHAGKRNHHLANAGKYSTAFIKGYKSVD